MRERWQGLIAATLVGWCVLAGAASSPAAAAKITVDIPASLGKHKVGTRSFQLTDGSRPAGFDQSGPRRLMVQVTYPLVKAKQGKKVKCRPSEYLGPGATKSLLGFISIKSEVGVNTRVCAGGTVMRKKLPLLIFSHAYTAARGVYGSLLADLASRGYMVAAVDHTSDAFAVDFPDGKTVKGVFGSPLASKSITEPELASLIDTRVADVRLVTDHLLRRNKQAKAWLGKRIDPRRVGVFGHSLGGATAIRAAGLDDRLRVSADIDGSLFGDWASESASAKPLLLLLAEKGLGGVVAKDKACGYFNRSTGAKVAWELTGASHLSFSDFQTLAPQFAVEDPTWVFAQLYPMIIGDLDPVASITAQRKTLARFFNRYLRAPGKAAPVPPTGIAPIAGERFSCE